MRIGMIYMISGVCGFVFGAQYSPGTLCGVFGGLVWSDSMSPPRSPPKLETHHQPLDGAPENDRHYHHVPRNRFIPIR
ncbi:hypothetical protein SeLEV6574_g06763 [Synchytrium endobioticum]|uniref:Secreted protein n=1 Tax=Synchytrium endobioticum TaxID=286115 RepID=A0A507CK78_9FUNG|nr:hypothetical protein SeLEV6574_g06763 [Synchytrium endobioticum]